jgi:hypothetical protein
MPTAEPASPRLGPLRPSPAHLRYRVPRVWLSAYAGGFRNSKINSQRSRRPWPTKPGPAGGVGSAVKKVRPQSLLRQGYGGQGRRASFAKAWPPKTFPRPSVLAAPRLEGLLLMQRDSQAGGRGGTAPTERGPTENSTCDVQGPVGPRSAAAEKFDRRGWFVERGRVVRR